MTDAERTAIYQRLTSFHWEPRWEWTGRYIIRRKRKLQPVRKSEVNGRWTNSATTGEVYEGEDYGKEYKGYLW